MEQKYTSANTSINSTKLPAIYSKVKEVGDPTISIIDYGCGKYLDNYKAKVNCELSGYDPYNRPDRTVLNKRYNIALCSNVLNVVKERSIRDLILRELRRLAPLVYITVYEGNRSGVGKVSKEDCWQENRKLADYTDELKSVFRNVTIKNGMAICQ